MTAVAAVFQLHAPFVCSPRSDTAGRFTSPDFVGPDGGRVMFFKSSGIPVVVRNAYQAAFTGRPFAPTGYAILALMVMAVALAAMFSTSSAGSELERASRLSWWFS